MVRGCVYPSPVTFTRNTVCIRGTPKNHNLTIALWWVCPLTLQFVGHFHLWLRESRETPEKAALAFSESPSASTAGGLHEGHLSEV